MTVILAGALALRLIGIERHWLWYDELLSVNFVAHGLWSTLIDNLRFDVHPPLYYLQLNLWAFLGRSDVWLMLNSVVWSVGAVAALYAAVRKSYDEGVALRAALLLALAPAALVFADQVRMYAFLTVLIVWAWRAQLDWLALREAGEKPGLWPTIALIASQAAITNSHSAGLVMVSGVVLLGAFTLWARRDFAGGVRWVLTEACVALLSVPAIAIAVTREASHPVAPDFSAFLHTWRFLAAGEMGPTLAGALAGLALAGALAWIFVRVKEMRLSIATLIIAPLFIAGAISLLVKPIWLDRVFITIAPFLCLVLACGMARAVSEPKRARAALIATACIWGVLAVGGQIQRDKGDGFRPAAHYVQSAMAPGDAVLVDGDFFYWCFMWYFAGHDWGRMERAYIMQQKWAALIARMGPGAAHALGFGAERADAVKHIGGATIYMWDRNTTSAPPQTTGDIYIVRWQGTAPIAFPGYVLDSARNDGGLTVDRLRREQP